MNLKRGLIAVVAILVLASAGWFGASLLLRPAPPPPPSRPKSLFADWAAIVVAGDWRAHSGAPSMVFDNARRDLVKKFVRLGFDPANIRQFSAIAQNFPYEGVQPADEGPISEGMAAVTAKATGGCLLYFTSHGSPEGIVIGGRIVDPAPIAAKVNQYCGDRPTVAIISACFSGIFVPMLQGPHRIVFTAARSDRTSFGCGEENQYTFFDTCVLSQIDGVASFPALAAKVKDCVSAREAAMNADGAKKGEKPSLPSEPQFFIDPAMVYGMNWK
jgi:hypothetical protein